MVSTEKTTPPAKVTTANDDETGASHNQLKEAMKLQEPSNEASSDSDSSSEDEIQTPAGNPLGDGNKANSEGEKHRNLSNVS